MTSFQEIRRFLKTVRRQMHWCNALEGSALWVLCITLITALGSIVVWLNGGEFLDVIRPLLGTCALTISIWVLIRRGWLPYRSFRTDKRLAQHIAGPLDRLQNDIISSVQLEKALVDTSQTSNLSKGMALALAKQTAKQLRQLRPKQMVPWRRSIRRTFASIVALTILAGLVSWQTHPFLEGGRILFFGVPEAQANIQTAISEKRDIVVRDITYTLIYPAYTERKNEVVPNSTGDLRVLQGTRIQLQTNTLLPAREASLLITGPEPQELQLAVMDGSNVQGEFTALEPQRFRFQLTTPDGRQVIERVERVVDILSDQPPRVSFIGTKQQRIVYPKDILSLRYEANDDYGITAVDLVVHRRDTEFPPIRHRLDTPNRTKNLTHKADLVIQELSLSPGENVECWLEAIDNNSLKESPQKGRSTSIKLTMHSDRNQHRVVLANHQALIESMIILLADRLESKITEQTRPQFDIILSAQTQIVASTERMLIAFHKLLDEMVRDPLMDNNVLTDMKELFQQQKLNHDAEMHQVKTGALLKSTTEERKKFKTLKKTNEDAIAQLEEDIILIEDLWKKLHQAQMVDQSKELVDAHAELTRLIESWKKEQSPEAKLKIQQQISSFIKKVQKLMAQMQQGATPTPLEHMNLSGLENTGDMSDLHNVQSSLQKIQNQVQNGEMDAAMALVDQMGVRIQNLASSLESDLKQMEVSSSPKSRAQLRRALSKLRSLVHRQNGVHRATEDVHDHYRDKLADVVRRELIPGIGEQLRELNRLTKQLNQIRSEAFYASDRKQFQAIQRTVEDLKETLTQEDISQAVRMARETKQNLDDLTHEVRFGLDHQRRKNGKSKQTRRLRQNVKALNKARPIAKRVQTNLEKMLPEVDELLNRREQRKLDKLGKRQQRVIDQLDRFQSRIEKLEESHPGLGRRLREQLTHTRKHMLDAKKRLTEHRPSPAVIQSRDALDRLGKAVEELENSRSNAKNSRGNHGLSERDRVAIPSEDQYQVPKEFRDELLRAIKERAPQRYQSRIDRYYEVLVQ